MRHVHFVHYCRPPPKRELIGYPDGQRRMFSGVCDNSESPLNKKPLVANFDAQMNASFHNLRIPRGVRCFSRK